MPLTLRLLVVRVGVHVQGATARGASRYCRSNEQDYQQHWENNEPQNIGMTQVLAAGQKPVYKIVIRLVESCIVWYDGDDVNDMVMPELHIKRF